MIFATLVIFLCIRVSDLAPLLNEQQALQQSANKLFYPGYQQTYLPNPYQHTPYMASSPYQPLLPQQSIQSADNNILLKQSFPGNIITAIPFLPIHINIPDLLQSIIRGLQTLFGTTNLPLIGNPTIVTPNMGQAISAEELSSSMGMVGNLRHGQYIPIIILIPQTNTNPIPLNTYDGVELKT